MKKYLIILSVVISGFCFSQYTDLQSSIDAILSKVPSSTNYGVMIYNPLSKDTLYSRNIHLPIKPASNAKLFTTGVALSLMGSDYELSTKLLTDDPNLSDGVINGNLYIKGYGNSLFTESDIDTLVADLIAQRITKITGRVYGDDTYFDSIYTRSDWIEDETTGNPLPPVSAIVLNRNRLHLTIRAAAKNGGAVNYSISPGCSLFDINNFAKTRGRRASIAISQHYNEYSYSFNISGTLGRRSVKLYAVEVKNPPLFAAYILQNKLLKSGIQVDSRPGTGQVPVVAYELNKKAITLKYLISFINKNSDNFLAECLYKTIGAFSSESQGNAFYATQAILTFLKDNNIYSEGTSIVDGSGLSHYNSVTISSVTELLQNIYLNPDIYFDFYNSLSIAGVDGTLRNRMTGTKAFNNFHGKTGTLNGAIALSGYYTSSTGDDLIVSILFEFNKGYAGIYRDIQDRIIELL